LNLFVLGFDDVELLTSDGGSTELKLFDQLAVVERELDVGDLNVRESWFRVLRFALEADCNILGEQISVEVLLDSFLEMHLQAEAWRDTLAVGTILSHVTEFEPFAVGFLEDLPFDGVVASSDGGHVPLHLLNLSALVQVSDLNQEEETDKNSHATHKGGLIKLSLQDFL
jgi:hypothetical protein